MVTEVTRVRQQLREATRSLAWSQWAALGVSTWERPSVTSLIDLEALIAFTGQRWPDDPRLAAQSIDWIASNMQLVSLHQVRSALTRHRWSFQGEFAAFARTAERFTHKKWPGKGEASPFLDSLPGKSRPVDLMEPALLGLRVRALFGLGARAEIIRHLLFHDWPHTASGLARELPYGSRQVTKDLELLHMAGLLARHGTGSRSHAYALINPDALHQLTGVPEARLVPWGDVYKVLTEVHTFLDGEITELRSPDSEFARRLRLVEPEMRRLDREEWWQHPADITEGGWRIWVEWLASELTAQL